MANSTSGHENEAINVSGLKSSLQKYKTDISDKKYVKPSGGIPKTDLASAVQTSLGKADSSLQSHQTIKQDGITGATVNRFGTCSTAAATAAKTVAITSGTFSLEAGASVRVKFSNANTAGTPTLNVYNGSTATGAKNIFHNGSQITTGGNKALLAGVCDFVYDGTQYHLVGNYIDTNTWNAASSSQAGYVPQATKGKFLHSNASSGNLEWVDDNNTTYTPQKLGIGIGTCATSSGTALAVTLADYVLVTNGIVAVTFQYDVPANATLNINSKGAKAIYYKGAAITADVIKAGDTVMFAYNGSQYVVTSLGGGASGSPNETVKISLTQIGGNSADLTGASITITDDDTGDTLYTATWAGTMITTEIDVNTNYTVSVDTISGYSSSTSQSYTAQYQNERSIGFRYLACGVYIESTDHLLYTSSTWYGSGKTPNSIVLIADTCKLRISLNNGPNLPVHSDDMTLSPYLVAISNEAEAKTDMNGVQNTNSIVAFNIAYGTNTTSYLAPYAKAFLFPDNQSHDSHIGSGGEWEVVRLNLTNINTCLSTCGGAQLEGYYPTSTFYGTRVGYWYMWATNLPSKSVVYNAYTVTSDNRPCRIFGVFK